MKMTTLTMDWNERGATVFYASDSGTLGASFDCPRCHMPVGSGTEHRCGDRVKKQPRSATAATQTKNR